MLNQQIGPYKIIFELGQGGMAIVYLAEKGNLNKKVALKVLRTDFNSNTQIRGRFLSEAKKMNNLSHPNIVEVHDLIDKTDFVAIELDYIEGQTLKQYIEKKGALTDGEIERFFKEMLDAVEYINKKGFVHRDIKPSNFMLTQNGTIKLTDFGIAKNMGDDNIDYTGTATGMQMGTPKYMSPEQVRNTKDVDYRSDIYSLGVVLWEMVTGRVPYDIQTESTFDVFRKIVDEPLKPTNTKWDAVIEKETQKEVGKRTLDLTLVRRENIRRIDIPSSENENPTELRYDLLKKPVDVFLLLLFILIVVFLILLGIFHI
jgi:serine/threonine protein kinase